MPTSQQTQGLQNVVAAGQFVMDAFNFKADNFSEFNGSIKDGGIFLFFKEGLTILLEIEKGKVTNSIDITKKIDTQVEFKKPDDSGFIEILMKNVKMFSPDNNLKTLGAEWVITNLLKPEKGVDIKKLTRSYNTKVPIYTILTRHPNKKYNYLKRLGIESIGEFMKIIKTSKELNKIKNIEKARLSAEAKETAKKMNIADKIKELQDTNVSTKIIAIATTVVDKDSLHKNKGVNEILKTMKIDASDAITDNFVRKFVAYILESIGSTIKVVKDFRDTIETLTKSGEVKQKYGAYLALAKMIIADIDKYKDNQDFLNAPIEDLSDVDGWIALVENGKLKTETVQESDSPVEIKSNDTGETVELKSNVDKASLKKRKDVIKEKSIQDITMDYLNKTLSKHGRI